ncbi:MAG: DUF1810 domain-containing protein [Ruminococcus sp.]|nr:DUF1810 domain-containing protein [Ruminococcus sp.]
MHPRRLSVIKITVAAVIFDRIQVRCIRSCMTLFEVASPYIPVFGIVLEKFYEGKRR